MEAWRRGGVEAWRRGIAAPHQVANDDTAALDRIRASLQPVANVVLLMPSADTAASVIQQMVAHWYRIRKEDGTTGYSYGFFFDVDPWELQALPTFYENVRRGAGSCWFGGATTRICSRSGPRSAPATPRRDGNESE